MTGRGKYLLTAGQLFEDQEFPPTNRSLFFNGENRSGIEITWMRPKDIHCDPQFVVYGAKYNDIYQGRLGDCWFLSGIVTVASQHQKFFDYVVPKNQNFDKDYTGMFRFNFFHYGQWVEVVIDDRLPTQNGKLLYCQNRAQPNEFWCSLLEKAYAKFYKCYQALDGGRPNDALVDMTGGLSELISVMADPPTDLPRTLRYARSLGSLMTAGIFNNPDRVGREHLRPNGLVEGHAYSITDMLEVTVLNKRILLLRVRNPWGQTEWKGNWSDGDKCWTLLDTADKQKIDSCVRNDGEFWMQYEDFVRQFDEIELVHLLEDAFTADTEQAKKKWKRVHYRGSWVRGQTAGGLPISDKFWTNPQYKLSVDRDAVVIVSIMEVDEKQRKPSDIEMSLFLYKVEKMKRPQRLAYENFYVDIFGSWPFREMTLRFELPPGTYFIIPCTAKPDQECNYYMRIGCEGDADISPVTHSSGRIDMLLSITPFNGVMLKALEIFEDLSGKSKYLALGKQRKTASGYQSEESRRD